MRPSGGLLRTREFIMKDLYSFHTDEEDLKNFYQKVKEAYFKIYKRCGINAVCVQASSGTIGGKMSEEFMAISPVGEDRILICQSCDFKSNIEKSGEMKACPLCGKKLKEERCIEIGHVFNLGDKYSKPLKANYRTQEGHLKPIIMGCYGIGLGRLLSTIVEVNHDKNGIIWPNEVAPFGVHLVSLFSGKKEIDQKIEKEAEKIYTSLQKQKIEVLYDDRPEKSAGEKLIEADLIGIPFRWIVSEKTLKYSSVEIKERKKEKKELVKIINALKMFLKKKREYVK
jgi:prolyl-tRNA synthetase